MADCAGPSRRAAVDLGSRLAGRRARLDAGCAANGWVKAIDKAAEKGDHKPSKDLLIHTDVIRPIGETSTHFSMMVKVGHDGDPAGPMPTEAKIAEAEALRARALEAARPKPDTEPN